MGVGCSRTTGRGALLCSPTVLAPARGPHQVCGVCAVWQCDGQPAGRRWGQGRGGTRLDTPEPAPDIR